MALTIPIWLLATIVFVILMALAVWHAEREASNSTLGIAGLEILFTAPVIIIAYLVFWVIKLAIR